MIQFIVMLAIMALWALTNLLSREAQPLPPRPGRGTGPNGARPGPTAVRSQPMPVSRRPGPGDRPATTMDRNVPNRWGDVGPTTRPEPGRGPGADDGIVILEPNARPARTAAPVPSSSQVAAARRGASGRRETRGRASAGVNAPKPAEAGRPRALTSLVSQSMAQKRNRPLEILPLASPLAPINSPLTQISTGAKIEHPGSPDSPPAFTSEALRVMLANSTKLREVALLTELLQPPLALRRSRRSR